MIRRLLARLFRPSSEIRQQATVLLVMHGPQGAWLEARDRRQTARTDSRWRDDKDMLERSRYWNSVMREVERQTGYRHQPGTSSR